ncbi:MAG TPA: CaiB/BaiF CoA-transferase family protein [Thermoplasmataceae archaeon]|nr:CoA transferase [Thermoplasmatales archaeon AK]HLH85899.1 CaiB/BaiF CoA-transferase family protein [Thermoplasmataceae archaeon]
MTRVLEIGHIVAGPTAGLIFADLGYEVIKIEKPGEGDIARRLTGTSSGAFLFYNRNKKSITLDFNKAEGNEIFKRLIAKSDVLIDNIGHGSLSRAGLSYDVLSEINPGLVYLSLKGYAKGPYESRKSLDYPIEVHSGIAYMNGLDGRPMRIGASIVDMTSAMFGVIWTLKALMDREQTGRGSYIDIGMFETAAFIMGQHIVSYELTGKPLRPLNEEGFAWAIYDFFRTKDQKDIFIAVTTDTQWREFCAGFNLGVCSEQRFSRNELRYEHRNELLKIVQEKISQMKFTQVEELLTKLNIAHATLNKPWDLLNDPQLKDKLASVTFNGSTILMPTVPGSEARDGKSPALGENTDEMLSSLGYRKEEIDMFRKNKII